jgi:hypothetical protein
MSPLRTALTEYLALRRALGFKLQTAGITLRQFVHFAEQEGVLWITTSIHVRRDSRSSIAYSEELISARMSATLQSTERHDGIVGQECCHFQLDL